MKPGKKDIPVKVKISGVQLDELKKHTWKMIEAFGLDTKIDNYKGIRPISFYSWDLDCKRTFSILMQRTSILRNTMKPGSCLFILNLGLACSLMHL